MATWGAWTLLALTTCSVYTFADRATTIITYLIATVLETYLCRVAEIDIALTTCTAVLLNWEIWIVADMGAWPFSATNITELIATSASHMIATLAFLYDILTIRASSVMKCVLKERQVKRIAFTFMLGEHTVGAKYFVACWTLRISNYYNILILWFFTF